MWGTTTHGSNHACTTTTTTSSTSSHKPSRFHKNLPLCNAAAAAQNINKYGRMISPGNYLLFWYNKKKRNAYSIDVGSEKNRSIIKNIERFLFYFMNVSIYQIQATIQKLFFLFVFPAILRVILYFFLFLKWYREFDIVPPLVLYFYGLGRKYSTRYSCIVKWVKW